MDIYNKKDMETFRNNVNRGMTYEGKNVRVMANIDLELTSSKSWEPIEGFNGNFYGNEFEIQNLYIKTTRENRGLFGTVGEKALISKVIIASGKITENANDTGGVVGINKGTVENCENRIEITGLNNIGGIVGENFGIIKNCKNQENAIISGTEKVGGICGYSEGEIERLFKLC